MFVAKNISAQKFIKVDDGIIVYPNQNLSGNVHAVKLQIYNDRIIRVVASAADSFQNKSLIILNQPSQKINFTVNGLVNNKTAQICCHNKCGNFEMVKQQLTVVV